MLPATVTTERLILRRPSPESAAEVNAAILETWEQLHEWMEWAVQRPSVEQTRQNLAVAEYAFIEETDFRYLAYLKDGGAFVLATGLHPHDPSVPSFEIGYSCRASMQGQGYTAEAVRALTRVGLDDLGANRLEIRCDSTNLRSRRVAERAGYQLEATLRHHRRSFDRKLRDTAIYSLMPSTQS